MNIRQAFQLAVQHHQSGRLAEAEVVFGNLPAKSLPQSPRWPTCRGCASSTCP